MIISRTVVKHEINGRTYELSVSPDSPLNEIIDVLYFYRGLIQEKIDEAAKQNEKVDEVKEGESSSQAS